MRVGTATVYVEQVGDPAVVYDEGGGIRPVAAPDLAAAFGRAGQAIQECVQTIGSRVEALAGKAKPQEIVVEFSLTFEAQGGIHLLPVFVTAQSKIGTGLKVTATWSLAGSEKPEGG
jgi:Trypsin-co-occurring domain 1